MMDTLVLSNIGNSPLIVDDLGIEILVGEDFDILQNFTAEDITESTDFQTLFIQGGRVTLNNSIIMTYQDVIDYLTPLTRWHKLDYSYISNKDDITDITSTELETLTDGSDTQLHNHNGLYYTETELQTPGASQVHYSNIIGSPTGEFRVENGDLYFRDVDRQGKWLSAAEEKYIWSDNNIDGKYMSIGNIISVSAGYLMPQDFTITKLAVSSTGNPTKQMQVRVNSNTVYIFNLIGGLYTATDLNIDIYTDDLLKMFVSGAGHKISDVVVTLFGKWRVV